MSPHKLAGFVLLCSSQEEFVETSQIKLTRAQRMSHELDVKISDNASSFSLEEGILSLQHTKEPEEACSGTHARPESKSYL
jgi:hypothetical protein